MSLKMSISAIALSVALALPISASAQVFKGDNRPNTFEGTQDGKMWVNAGRGYDQIRYEGSIGTYGFERVSRNRVLVRKQNGHVDTLINIERVSFSKPKISMDWNRIFAPIGSQKKMVVYQGTPGNDAFVGVLNRANYFIGRRGADQVNYAGGASQYTFTRQNNRVVKVTKPNGAIDLLNSIERIFFVGDGRRHDMKDLLKGKVVPEAPTVPDVPTDPNLLYHFGEPVTLVGANIAWSENSRFSSDFGRSDGFGNPSTNLVGFNAKLDEISQNGGNSARIWLHTTAQVSPNIDPNGITLGLSRELTDQQVVDELIAVLDSAWERGILVTYSLFSFDMLCDHYADHFGYTGDMERNHTMLTTERQQYFDNALTPIVNGLKDHPALFAYEIFNEPEGAYQGNSFCETTFPINSGVASSFVNEAAATIHELDSNVKVTTSTHTDLFDNFSNATLLAGEGADPAGVLDFYELHWYAGWGQDPFTTPKSSYDSDRPIVIGEFQVEQVTGVSAIGTEETISTIIDNGYAGAWPWSLVSVDDAQSIRGAIHTAQQTPIDKVAVETCILNKAPDCYKN